MSVESHLSELRRRHEVLERRISEEQTRPGSSDLQIAALKREKLQLKDQITRLAEMA